MTTIIDKKATANSQQPTKISPVIQPQQTQTQMTVCHDFFFQVPIEKHCSPSNGRLLLKKEKEKHPPINSTTWQSVPCCRFAHGRLLVFYRKSALKAYGIGFIYRFVVIICLVQFVGTREFCYFSCSADSFTSFI